MLVTLLWKVISSSATDRKDLPSLSEFVLGSNVFNSITDYSVSSTCRSIFLFVDASVLEKHPAFSFYIQNVTVRSVGELKLNSQLRRLVVGNSCCNDPQLTRLDLTGCSCIQEVIIGNNCFERVEEVKLVGLKELESVVIGLNSFTMKKESCGNDPNRRFYLKDCVKVRELKIDRFSFSDYSVCVIESTPSLQVIEMGGLNEDSCNFYSASLELKGVIPCRL